MVCWNFLSFNPIIFALWHFCVAHALLSCTFGIRIRPLIDCYYNVFRACSFPSIILSLLHFFLYLLIVRKTRVYDLVMIGLYLTNRPVLAEIAPTLFFMLFQYCWNVSFKFLLHYGCKVLCSKNATGTSIEETGFLAYALMIPAYVAFAKWRLIFANSAILELLYL